MDYGNKNDHKNAARLLLKQGTNINLADYSRYTPLYHATENSYKDVVELLLEWKIVVNTVNCDGKISSYYAVKAGFQRIGEYTNL